MTVTDPRRVLVPAQRKTLATMAIGLVLNVLAAAAVVAFDASGRLSDHLHDVYDGYAEVPASGVIVGYLVGLAVLGVVCWSWMMWAVVRGKRWAPLVFIVLFVLATGIALTNLFVQEYGSPIVPSVLGVAGLLPCVAGLVAVLLARRLPR